LDSDHDHALTEKVIGLAMKVHGSLGPGFLESVYFHSLVHELRRRGFSAEVAKRITVRYENVIVGDFVADLLVKDTLFCEPKAIGSLSKADEVQLLNYLLNFGTTSLPFKRKHRRLPADQALVDLHNPVNPVDPV
jgi:GxxExxY protein